MQEHLFRHFYNEGRESFLKNVSITLIDKKDVSDPKQRKNYQILTLRTLAPDGLNVEGSI